MDDQKIAQLFGCNAPDNRKPDVVKVQCSHCGRVYAGRVPKGGDGSLFLPRRHTFEGPRNGSPCPGNIQEAEIVLSDQPVPTKPTKEFKAAFHRMAEKAFLSNVTLHQIMSRLQRYSEERSGDKIAFVLDNDGSGNFCHEMNGVEIVAFDNINELQEILITQK